jgi:UDP-glucose 4-epimerase
MNLIMRGKRPFIYGDGEQTRAFSFVEDATPAIANAGLYSQANGEIVNVGSDEVVTINRACEIVLEAMNSKLQPIYLQERPGEAKHAYCTVNKSERLLDYKTTTPLRSGVAKMVGWAKRVGPRNPAYRIPLEIKKKAPQVWREQMI